MTKKAETSGSDIVERSLVTRLAVGITKRVTYLLIFCAGASVVALFAEQHWIADLSANLRVQLVIGVFACGLLALVCRQWKWLTFAIILLVIQSPWFVPVKTPTLSPASTTASSTATLKVTTVNVLTHNHHHDEILAYIENCNSDVVAVLELGSSLSDRLDTDKVFSKTHPHKLTYPQDNGNFGIGLYSRFELEDANLFFLNLDTIESIEATVEVEGQDFRIVATHPLPPVGNRHFRYRNDHLKMLTERLAIFQNAKPEVPLIVMGDFNLTPWSPIFAKFVKANSLDRASSSFPATPTWYVGRQVFPLGLALDHILVSPELMVTSFEVGPDIGSDHRGVTAEITKK